MMRLASRVLIVIGLTMLGWCGFVWLDAAVAQYVARQSLDLAGPAPESPSLRSMAAPTIVQPAPPPRHGASIAALTIPRVRLSAIVLQGSDARTLRRGPGHVEHTALPGERGNIVIAGHRDSFFRQLRDVAVGDDVWIEGPAGRLRYRIASLRVVEATDLTAIAPTSDETLTLITCFPFWVLGDAPDRFVVRATRVDESSAGAGNVIVSIPIVDAPVPQVAPRHTTDDESLIRQTLMRFRLAYNARLASRAETRHLPPLTFAHCDVSVDGDAAGVQCGASRPAPESGVAATWLFALERDGAGWAIKEVVSQ